MKKILRGFTLKNNTISKKKHKRRTVQLLNAPISEGNGDVKKMGQDKKMLENLLDKRGMQTDTVPVADISPPLHPDPAKLPAFIYDAIADIEARGINHEGIFRKSSSKVLEDKIFEDINRTPSEELYLLHIDFSKFADVHIPANIIKKYLRNLEEPLLTFDLYQTFLSTQDTDTENTDNSNLAMLQKACTLLPKSNYELLKLLCLFLKKVVDKQKLNLMTAYNLAVIFQPSILYLRDQHPMETFNQMKTAIGVVKNLIESSELVFNEVGIIDPKKLEQKSYVLLDQEMESPRAVNRPRRTSIAQSIQQGEQPVVQVYTGDLNHLNKKHGKGKLMLPDGRIYNGHFMNDLFHGKGEMVEPSGACYVGDWVLGKKEGQGVMYYQDRCKYEGQFKNDLRSGKGMIIYPDGSIYDGEWEEDKPHGEGVFIDHNECKYIGFWKAGKYHGKGVLQIYTTNETYEGEFVDGEYDGQGKYTSTSVRGSHVYEGTFKSAAPWNGSGSIASDEKTIYTGDWVNGSFTGTAYIEFPDGKIYEGQMVNFLFNGEGVMRYPDGTVYIGFWKDGKKYGYGKQRSVDGTTYEGEFYDNMFEGEGTLTSACNKVFQGEFRTDSPWLGAGIVISGEDYYEGKFVKGLFYGYGRKCNSDGSVYEGQFEKTEFHGTGKLIFIDGSMFEGTFANNMKVKGVFTDKFGCEYEMEYDPVTGDMISCEQITDVASEEKKKVIADHKISNLVKTWNEMKDVLDMSKIFSDQVMNDNEEQAETFEENIQKLGNILTTFAEEDKSNRFLSIIEMMQQLTELIRKEY